MTWQVIVLAVSFGNAAFFYLWGHHRAWSRARKQVDRMVASGDITWSGRGF